MRFNTLGWLALFSVSLCGAGRVCNLTLNECPGRFASGLVSVPEEFIGLDPKVPYCNEPVQLNPSGPPPSIVFIIDNSGSMDENDPAVARFSVVSNLLDNIYAVAPSTEVGLVIFSRRLAFDHRENAFFRTAFPGDTAQHDSFAPLTPLNRAFATGVRGLDTLKALLKHDLAVNLAYNTRLPASRSNFGMGRTNTRDGTDISLGFQAAKVAMQDSKSDRSRQFFIFLSDGAASTPDIGREGLVNDYISGTATPATFTVFFDTQHFPPLVPPTIVQMTANIRASNFSVNNAKSAFWAINTPGVQLENVVQDEIIGKVIFLPTTAKYGTVAIGEHSYASIGVEGKSFVFTKPMPLAKTTTQILLNYTYAYLDTSGGTAIPREKLVPYLLNIQRIPGAPLPPGLGQSCREQGELALYRDGLPINVVKADDAALEARLAFPPGQTCTGCILHVSPGSTQGKDQGKDQDREGLALVPKGGALTTVFAREINALPVPGDGKLQHLPKDSIVLTWENPENPLDLVRKAYAYLDIATAADIRRFNDVARTQVTQALLNPEWTVLGPPGLALQVKAGAHWKLQTDSLSRADSISHLGVDLTASRAFTADIKVFTNLGLPVHAFAFTVSPAEFDRLPKTGIGNTRTLRVLWDNRDQQGHLAGTGAYIIKTSLTLLRIPGIAEDRTSRNEYHLVGILRAQ